MRINVQGLGAVEVTNWEEFERQVLFLVGEGITNEIEREALKMGLFISGRFIRGIGQPTSPVIKLTGNGVSLVWTNDAPYAAYLEYGTYEFGEGYTETSWPEKPFPKKKTLKASARTKFPRGMQPFAPYRRILYSQERVEDAVKVMLG